MILFIENVLNGLAEYKMNNEKSIWNAITFNDIYKKIFI